MIFVGLSFYNAYLEIDTYAAVEEENYCYSKAPFLRQFVNQAPPPICYYRFHILQSDEFPNRCQSQDQ